VVVVLAASALVVRLINGLHFGPTEILLLGGVLVAAAAFGLVAGLLAAAGALIGYRLLVSATIPPFDLASRGSVLLAGYAISVVAVGFYTDLVRQRERQARSLLEVARPLSARASDRAVGQFVNRVEPAGAAISRMPMIVQARRALTALGIVGTGLGLGFALHGALGVTGGMLIALASVVAVAGLMGARYGLAAGALAGIVLTIFLRSALSAAPMPPLEQAFDLALFSLMGWGVGLLFDRLQHERAVMKTLTAAGRDLSAGADEMANRRVLYDSLRQIGQRATVHLFDENGVQFPAADAPSQHTLAEDDGSRTHPLTADVWNVGRVRWRYAGSPLEVREADHIAMALIELGASAIVRTRLNAERAEMEYFARAEQLRAILLDTVSHHFRSPLAGILGSVTSILNLPDRHDRSARHELLLIIKEQANRLGRYVDNFLSLARLESGSLEITRSDISLEALVYDVWDTFGEVGSARRYLHVDVDPDPIWSDASLLTQVFGNVLENAIKYSPEESVVRVHSHRQAGRLIVEVSDQGSGVPESSVGRMFERFYRSQGAKAPGLGLGLYITRSLVEMLGGEVAARNRTDDGSGLIVTITLPLAERFT
jgi:K+-sensing histidine kinase KdpD